MTTLAPPSHVAPAPARIYLDPADDAATIRARIEAAPRWQSGVELFVPLGQRTLRTPVGMALFERFIDDTLLPIHLITADSEVRRLAREKGLRCSGQTLEGQPLSAALKQDGERSPTAYARYARERQMRSAGRWRGIRRTAALLVLALTPPLTAAWVLIPTATITLTVPAQQVSQAIDLRVSSLAAAVDLQDGTIPGRVMEVPVDVSVKGLTTGAVPDPKALARGTARFISHSDQPVRIPGGTVIATEASLKFRTQNEIIAHPGLPQGISVAVTAIEPGPMSNVGAKEIRRIEDARLAATLRVENDTALTGGANSPEKAVTEADYRQLRGEAINQARDTALRHIEERLGPDRAIAPGSLRIRITTEDLDPRIGAAASAMTLTITGNARALTMNNEDIRTIVRRRIADSTDEELAAGAQLSVSLGKSISADNDIAVFETSVEGTVGRWLEESDVKRIVAGKTPIEARRLLTQLAPDATPAIRLDSFWADRVSPFHWRINVVQAPG